MPLFLPYSNAEPVVVPASGPGIEATFLFLRLLANRRPLFCFIFHEKPVNLGAAQHEIVRLCISVWVQGAHRDLRVDQGCQHFITDL